MAAQAWQVYGFMDAVREWMRRDPPANDLMIKVVEFGDVLERDPERGAAQEHANEFYREVPGTEHDGRIVSISFSSESSPDPAFAGVIRCQDIACVEYPTRGLFEAWPPPSHH